MSIFDEIADAVTDVVGRGADALNEIAQGDFKGAVNAVLGGNRNINCAGPGDLVQQIQDGAGTPTLQRARDIGVNQSSQQDKIETESRQMMAALESAWTGKSSDAARVYVEPLATTAASASESLRNNSSIVQDQIHQFDSLKNTMHKDVTNQAPERNFWDKATPWDTDTEDEIATRNRKVQENLERYNTYAAHTDANKPAMTIDYGQLTDDQGGDFELEKEKPPTPPGKKQPPGKRETTVGKSSEQTGKQTTGDPGGPNHPPVYASDTPHNLTPPPEDTRTSGWKPPIGTTPLPHDTQIPVGQNDPNYRNPNQSFNSGFGPGGGSGFGPGGGSGSGSGRGFGPGGGSSSGTGQNLVAGKGSGTGMPGEGVRGGPGAGNAGRGGGRPGGPGMGGGMPGGAKGKGEEDAEHQRPSYLVEADPESVFGTDAKTAPPVIGA